MACFSKDIEKDIKGISWIYSLRQYGFLTNRMLECVKNKTYEKEMLPLAQEKDPMNTVYYCILFHHFDPFGEKYLNTEWRSIHMCMVEGTMCQ